MKRRKKVLELLMAGFIWWAIFYPDLYLVEEDCCVVECENDEADVSSEQLLEQICKASPKNIVIKSKLWEWLQSVCKE